MSSHVNQILRKNLYEVKLDKAQMERLIHQKEELRQKLKEAGTGDAGVKEYLIMFIAEYLLNGMHLDEDRIKDTFLFCENGLADVQIQFDLLLYILKQQYGKKAFETLIEENQLLQDGAIMISKEQISKMYEKYGRELKFVEQLDLLSRKIYASYKGLGIIDELRDMDVDGISGGVSGKAGSFCSAWVFYHGRSIYLPFMDFESESEIERIARNLCRYHQPGEISRKKGFMVHEMADHARVVIVRPDFAENWMFFIRKLDNIPRVTLEELVTGENSRLPIEILTWLMRGCQVTAVTGIQGCGKTTLLTALVEKIPKEYTIRVLELAFELHLRERYEERNIVTFRETTSIDGYVGLEVQKKTDGAVSIIGEVASAKVAAWMIESGQTGSLFTIFTHHAKTTKSLLLSLRNSLLKEGNFQSEKVALEQVVDVVRFDVHLHMDRKGHRFIERIEEIIPDGEQSYRSREIMHYDGTRYVQTGKISKEVREEMNRYLTKEERTEFLSVDI